MWLFSTVTAPFFELIIFLLLALLLRLEGVPLTIMMHLYEKIELGGGIFCSHSVRQEVKCASVTGWGAGGGDQRDTRTVGNDASHDASDSDFMVRSARIRVCREGGQSGGTFTLRTDY